ncbi:MAG: T9SS type A sorting domain-containing protein, partial [Cryomorphaceae bacterium]|nr:T9SS type A sorting domain-containing protein [Cryomorphaceae bacterium]
PQRLNVGLDRNNDHSDKTFFSLDGGVNWIQSQISGSVMVRPIFSTSLDAELSVEQNENLELEVYPNPVVDLLTIQVNPSTVENVTVFDAQGGTMYNGVETVLDMSSFSSGIYFVRVQSIGNPAQIIKVIKY